MVSFAMTGCAGMDAAVARQQAGVPGDHLAELTGFIQEEMKARNITGLSISVADSREVVWAEGFGTADRKNHRQFTSSTISNVGSVSKLVTATAIMRLAEQGLVDLDAPVSRYIPEFAPSGAELLQGVVTVRMLLNHESGLESDAFKDFFLGDETPNDYPHSYRRAIEAVNHSGMVREPYTMFSYCNLGYSLLGIIGERAAGGDFEQAVRSLVFEPLGMEDSSFLKDKAPEERLALGYARGSVGPMPYIRDMPAGSLNSSAVDMGAFLQGMLKSYNDKGGLLESSTIRGMLSPSNQSARYDLDFEIGLGWWIVDMEELPGEFIVAHGGDLPPYHAVALMLPERDLAVFVMVNSVDGIGSFSLSDIASAAIRAFAVSKNQSPLLPAVEMSPAIPVSEVLKQALPGFYATPAGLAEIRSSGDGLKIFAFNTWLDLECHADGSLSMSKRLLGFIPINIPVLDELSFTTENVDGLPSINLRVHGVLMGPCLKIEPPRIDPSWLARQGTYVAIENEAVPQYSSYRIALDRASGFLCLELKSGGKWSSFPLETLDGRTARLAGIGRGLGGRIRASVDGETEILGFLNLKLHRR
jgi:CubicO group peptidase (beta-lactamase class C family)